MFYKGFLGVYAIFDGPVPRTASQSMMDGYEDFGPPGRMRALVGPQEVPPARWPAATPQTRQCL